VSKERKALVKADLDDLYRLYMNDIYRYLLKLTLDKSLAEDLTQETYVRACQFLHSFRGEKVRPWLFKVAYHTFVDKYRKNKRTPTLPLPSQFAAVNQSFKDPTAELLKRELWQQFSKTIADFPTKQKQSLLLFYYHQFTYGEIAEILDIPLADVKSAIYRGKQKLRTLWKEDEHGSQI